MKSEYAKGWIKLNNGKCVDALFHREANRECARVKKCVCGFCKGEGQCGLGDCHNAIPTAGEVTPKGVVTNPGNICVPCEDEWTAGLPGHRRSIFAKQDEPLPQSGYTPCACRDCLDTTVSSDMSKPELCSECKDAGCEPWNPDDNLYRIVHAYKCQRDDAYGEC